MECKQEENKLECSCTSLLCKRRGMCCECVRHHRDRGEIPACFFPKGAEVSHNRSIENFIKVYSKKI